MQRGYYLTHIGKSMNLLMTENYETYILLSSSQYLEKKIMLFKYIFNILDVIGTNNFLNNKL